MHINEDYPGFFFQVRDFSLRGRKGIIQVRHENASMQIHDAEGGQSIELKNGAAVAGRPCRIIERAQEPALLGEQHGDLFLVPKVVATGDYIDTGRKDLLGCLRCDSRSTSGILAIGDHNIDRVSRAQVWNERLNSLSSRLAYDFRD